jgi:hypothetical protein
MECEGAFCGSTTTVRILSIRIVIALPFLSDAIEACFLRSSLHGDMSVVAFLTSPVGSIAVSEFF